MNLFCYKACLVCLATSNLLAQQSLVSKAISIYNIDSVLNKENTLVEKYKAKKDTEQLINAYIQLATKCSELSRFAKAEEACASAIKLSSAKKNNVLIASCYTAFANMYNYKQDNAKALTYYLKAKELFDKSTNLKKQLQSLIDLVEYYRKVAQYEESQRYINSAFYFYKTKHVGDTLQLIRLYNRQAAVKYEINDKDSSLYFSFKAIEYCKLIHNKVLEASSLNEIGAVYRDKKDLPNAIKYISAARDTWLNAKAYRSALEASNNLALLYEKNNYPKQLIVAEYTNIINLCHTNKIDFPLFNAYEYLHKLYITKNDTGKAYINILELKKSHESYMYQKLNTEIVAMQEKYENEKIKNETVLISNELSSKKKETFFVYTIVILLLVLLSAIAYLLYTNIKKNRLLQSQNVYKDVLIKEIHHRVKNNLEFINSLIDMQKNASENKTEIHSLTDAARRISSMSIVHEMLYNKDKIEGVQLKNYLEELVSYINEMINAEALPIQFKLSIQNVIITPTQAIAIGMITSELISNAIKYAFENEDKPCITLDFAKQPNGECKYSVNDNGKGYAVNLNNNKLGMRLIDIFSRQLKGNYTFENKQGLTYTIIFKL